MQETIYATFADPNDAERAAGALLDNGVRENDLTIIKHHKESAEDVEYRSATESDDEDSRITAMPGNVDSGMSGMPVSTPEYAASPTEPAYSSTVYSAIDARDTEVDSERAAKEGVTPTTAGDAAIGAARGVGWGFGIGAVAALGALFVPGVGLVIGGGALATAIAAAAATAGAGALAGAVTGFLKDQGFEEQDGVRYEQVAEGGGALLGVSLPSGKVDGPMAWEIIDKYHGAPLSLELRTRTSYLA